MTSIPELPFADDLLATATRDLDATRALLQRFLAIGDALFASTLTVASLFAGLAFSNHRRAVAWSAIPIVLCLGYLDGANWVRFRRASTRIRDLEGLFQAYISALRETKASRPDAVRGLRQRIDHYQFGIERTLKPATVGDVWRVNYTRLRWWLYLALALVLLACALFWIPSP